MGMIVFLLALLFSTQPVQTAPTYHLDQRVAPYYKQLGVTPKYDIYVKKNLVCDGVPSRGCSEAEKVTYNPAYLDAEIVTHEHLHREDTIYAPQYRAELMRLAKTPEVQHILRDYNIESDYDLLLEVYAIAGTELDPSLLSDELNNHYNELIPNRHILFE